MAKSFWQINKNSQKYEKISKPFAKV